MVDEWDELTKKIGPIADPVADRRRQHELIADVYNLQSVKVLEKRIKLLDRLADALSVFALAALVASVALLVYVCGSL